MSNESNFKHALVEAQNLDELYFFSIRELFNKGRRYKIDSGSYEGDTRLEFDSFRGIIYHPTQRPLAPQSRPGIPVPTNDSDIEEYFYDYLMNGRLQPNEHYKYATWIVGIPEFFTKGFKGRKNRIPLKYKGIPRGTRLNQLEWCINHFKKKGFGTNHCYITVGCAEGLKRYDWPYKDETERGTTECLRGFSLNITEGKNLNLECFFRSWDLVNGLPVNLGGLALVMEYAASELGIEPGVMVANSSGLHAYGFSEEFAKIFVNIKD